MQMDKNPVRKLYEHTDSRGRRLEAWTWDDDGLNLVTIRRDDPEQPEERCSVIVRMPEVGVLLGALQRHPAVTRVEGPVPQGLGYLLTLTVGDAKLEISDSASLTAPAMALLAQGVSESMARFDGLAEPPYTDLMPEAEGEETLQTFLGALGDALKLTSEQMDAADPADLISAVQAMRSASDLLAAVQADSESNARRATNAERQLRSLENVLAGSPLQSVVGNSSAPWATQNRAEALVEAAKWFVQIRAAFKARGRDFPPGHTPEAVETALADQAALTELRAALDGAKLNRLAAMTAADLAAAVQELIVSRQNASRLEEARRVAIMRNAELIEHVAELDDSLASANALIDRYGAALRDVQAELMDPNSTAPTGIELVASQSAAIIARIDRVLSGEEVAAIATVWEEGDGAAPPDDDNPGPPSEAG